MLLLLLLSVYYGFTGGSFSHIFKGNGTSEIGWHRPEKERYIYGSYSSTQVGCTRTDEGWMHTSFIFVLAQTNNNRPYDGNDTKTKVPVAPSCRQRVGAVYAGSTDTPSTRRALRI